MIVSYSRNFIFIRTKKTAGTTVEALLSAGCVPGDIVTLTPQEALNSTESFIDPDDPSERGTGLREVDGQNFQKHMTAAEAYHLIDHDFWNAAYKFTVERHPYEKAVSQAFYKYSKKRRRGDFEEYLDHVVREGDYPGFPRWSIAGNVAVDDFMRQETLKVDLDRVGGRLGISIPDELPRMKGRTRTDSRPARVILTEAQRTIVYERCAREFEILGWER